MRASLLPIIHQWEKTTKIMFLCATSGLRNCCKLEKTSANLGQMLLLFYANMHKISTLGYHFTKFAYHLIFIR
jgi:hypothetical protein